MSVHSGEYQYVIDVHELTPPMSGGDIKYVAAVKEIVKPGAGGPERFPVQIGECYGATTRGEG